MDLPARRPAVSTVLPGALVITGGGMLGLGALVTGVGPGAFVGTASAAAYAAIGPLLGALGVGALLAGVLLVGRGPASGVSIGVPRLFPYAGLPTQLGIFLLAILSTAAVVSALLAEYTGSLGGGDPTTVADPSRLNALYLAASGLLWVFAAWVILLIARVVGIGRALERTRGRNVYGAFEEEAPQAAPPKAGVPAGPAPPHQRPAVVVAAVVLALVAMAGIQALEVGADPPPLGLWIGAELATPVWGFALAWAVLGIDGYVRDLERQYAAHSVARPGTAPAPSAVDAAPGFVP